MTQKDFRKSRRWMLGAGAATTLPLGSKAQTAKSTRPPNIIFIVADDLGVADVGCYGAPQIKTPAIDSLAAGGAKFTQAYSNSAVCTASRVGIITGRYQYRLPLGLEEPLSTNDPIVGLPPSHPTLPSLLRKAGYSTYLIGKWHLGNLPDYGPLKSGYDHFWGYRAGAVDYFSHQMAGKYDLWDGDTEVHTNGYLTNLIGARAVDVVRAHARGAAPYFISVHFSAPHWPWEGPDDEAHSREIGNVIQDVQGAKLATYNKMVEAMDRQIGAILAALARSGQADNTIVLFTSDNGGERLSNTWPFTGKKGELLEGGIRVPALVRWPGHIRPRTVSQQVMIHMDWLPTLLAAAGTSPDPAAPSDGMNLLPLLTAKAGVQSRTLYWRYKANAQRAVRDGDYKALKIGGNSYLFNVADDPLERSDLKAKYPEIYRRLTDEWSNWNRAMLPEVARSYTYANVATNWADHFNVGAVDLRQVDDGGAWPTP
jgi:arylsulfatase A-like enzyme